MFLKAAPEHLKIFLFALNASFLSMPPFFDVEPTSMATTRSLRQSLFFFFICGSDLFQEGWAQSCSSIRTPSKTPILRVISNSRKIIGWFTKGRSISNNNPFLSDYAI